MFGSQSRFMKTANRSTQFLLTLAMASCGSEPNQSSSLQNYEVRNRTAPECGVATYKTREHKLCGVAAWKSARSPACGVELFKSAASEQCPGYRPESTYRINKTSTCGGSDPRTTHHCHAGDVHLSFRSEKQGCWKNMFDRGSKWKFHRDCKRPEIKKHLPSAAVWGRAL